MCDTERMEKAYAPLPNREMWVKLRFDHESFDTLKELLWKASQHPTHSARGSMPQMVTSEESAAHRRDREALKRVFDQIRNVMYSDV